MSLTNKNNKVNVLTLLTLSAALLLTACGGSSSNDIPPLFYEFKDLELTLEDIEAPRLALGHNHTCFITSDEQVKCWGDSKIGQLGNDAITIKELENAYLNDDIEQKEYETQKNQLFSNVPVSVKNIVNATQISSAENHTCALLSDGTIKCWGDNAKGQLGNSDLGNTDPNQPKGGDSASAIPVLVNVDSLDKDKAIAISVSGSYSCGIFETNGVQCWGETPNGFDADNLELVSNLNPVQLATSYRYNRSGFACAVTGDNTIQCWGNSIYLGQAEGSPLVYDINNALHVSNQGAHTCALLDTGRVKCWGYNPSGQVGVEPGSEAKTNGIYMPNLLNRIGEVTSLSAAGNNTCAVTQRGSVECWGANSGGQLGYLPPEKNSQNSHINYYSSSPKVIELPSKFEAAEVAVGQSHICARARLTNDELYCWGKNDRGQLGNGKKLSDGSSNLSTLSTPVKVQL